jgi:hypothetical protein
VSTRRFTIHAPQLVGRDWKDASSELQRFLRYMMDANDGSQTGAAAASTQLSAVAQNVSTLSQALSVEIINRTSADNVLSNAVSVVFAAIGAETSNRVSADNALSNVISVLEARVSVNSAGTGLTFAEAMMVVDIGV